MRDNLLPVFAGILRYALLLLGVGLLALAGYTAYLLYPRFNLPGASGLPLLLLAATAGMASFFSPCSFPLLLTLLARATDEATESRKSRLRRNLRFASALALGATLFLLLTGSAFAVGAAVFFEGITFTSRAGRIIRTLAGSLLVGLGLIQSGILPNIFSRAWRISQPLRKAQAKIRRSHPTLAFSLFGFGYLLSGVG
jgi:cytochrome c-type biogenesis protein